MYCKNCGSENDDVAKFCRGCGCATAGAPPVRVEDAHSAIVSKRDFQKARRLLGSRAPKKVNPRRASSPYLLSGIAKCETCGKARVAVSSATRCAFQRGLAQPPRLSLSNGGAAS